MWVTTFSLDNRNTRHRKLRRFVGKKPKPKFICFVKRKDEKRKIIPATKWRRKLYGFSLEFTDARSRINRCSNLYLILTALRHQCCWACVDHFTSMIIKPGQGVKQDLAVSVSLPTQCFPPFIGGGWLHGLVLFKMVPPDIPHVWEHRVQGVQEPQLPSRGPAETQRSLTRVGYLWSIL